jgi:hypothetical protein
MVSDAIPMHDVCLRSHVSSLSVRCQRHPACHARLSQQEKADSTPRSSQAVPHPSTNRALRRLTSEVRRDPVHSTRYGRQREAARWVNAAHSAFTTPFVVLACSSDIAPLPIDLSDVEAHIIGGDAFLQFHLANLRIAPAVREKLTAPQGLPRRSPTLVLTGPCAA